MPDYLPHREAELLAWSANWAAVTSMSPNTFGLTVEQTTDYQTLHDAFADAYAVTQGPNRGPAATQTKNTAKDALIRGPGGIRQLVGIVQKFPGTTDTMRVQLNISVPDDEPTPIPPPSDAPEIDFISTGTRTIRIRFHNEHSLQRAKPEGVVGLTVFSFMGETPPLSLSDWKFEANSTKTLVDINPPAGVPSGTTMWITAFWRNPRDESGPACTPQSTVVQYGGLSQAA